MTKTIDRGALAIMLGLSASVLAGCDRPSSDWRVCEDSQGRRAPDSNCGSSGHVIGAGRWLYFRAGSAAVPAVGEPIAGGLLTPEAGVSYDSAPTEGITRGGFGASGDGHGGGDGGSGE